MEEKLKSVRECGAYGRLSPATGGGQICQNFYSGLWHGIRPENLPRIFDPYFTTKANARGLGLASAYSVVRKHDGQINVESQVAHGSTFQIYLPASLKPVEMAVPEDEPRRFFGQGRILIMDDEADILFLVGEMLELMGYEWKWPGTELRPCSVTWPPTRDNPF